MTDPTMFYVAGTPKPQGSIRAFVRGGRAVLTSTTKGLHEWRDTIRKEADHALANGGKVLSGPVAVRLTFYLQPPKSHKPSGEGVDDPVSKRPDIDKLSRAALDALTGVAYHDDSQVAELAANKLYATEAAKPGVLVSLRPLAGAVVAQVTHSATVSE